MVQMTSKVMNMKVNWNTVRAVSYAFGRQNGATSGLTWSPLLPTTGTRVKGLWKSVSDEDSINLFFHLS